MLFSPADVSGQRSLDLRSQPSCVVPLADGEVVLSPQWKKKSAFLAALNSIYITHGAGRSTVNWNMMFIEEPPEFLWYSSVSQSPYICISIKFDSFSLWSFLFNCSLLLCGLTSSRSPRWRRSCVAWGTAWRFLYLLSRPSGSTGFTYIVVCIRHSVNATC